MTGTPRTPSRTEVDRDPFNHQIRVIVREKASSSLATIHWLTDDEAAGLAAALAECTGPR